MTPRGMSERRLRVGVHPMVRGATAWLCPLPALLVGAAVARDHGVPLAAFGPNAMAAIAGAALAWLLLRLDPTRRQWVAARLPALAGLAIAATMLMPATDGVQRWLWIGPLRLHAAAALAPWLLLPLARPGAAPRAGVLPVAAALLHVAQPDAAAATALAAGSLPLVSDRGRAIGAALPAVCAAWAWTRPDALAPVGHVEGIVGLARASGPWLAAAAIASLALLAAPALHAVVAGTPTVRRVGASILLSLAATWVAAVIGVFPVGVLGAGAGPVLGWFAAMTWLAWTRREAAG
jgi:hypothetical protein